MERTRWSKVCNFQRGVRVDLVETDSVSVCTLSFWTPKRRVKFWILSHSSTNANYRMYVSSFQPVHGTTVMNLNLLGIYAFNSSRNNGHAILSLFNSKRQTTWRFTWYGLLASFNHNLTILDRSFQAQWPWRAQKTTQNQIPWRRGCRRRWSQERMVSIVSGWYFLTQLGHVSPRWR